MLSHDPPSLLFKDATQDTGAQLQMSGQAVDIIICDLGQPT